MKSVITALFIWLSLCLFGYASAVPIGPAGMVDMNVTQDNIKQTICVPGYTKKVRPSTYFTNKLKKRLMVASKVTGSMRDYELDHVIPLALGGAPKDLENLQLQPWKGPKNARIKDVLETKLHRLVCKNAVSLRQAQMDIGLDWEAAYEKYVGPLPSSAVPVVPITLN